jgi:hypothetical protein
LQRDVLVFDWWVRNTDRLRGNTNLLWDTAHEKLVVIDHNLALDKDFNTAEFLDQHVFAEQWQPLAQDLVTQAQYLQRLSLALAAARTAIAHAPQEWLWENSEFNILTLLTVPRHCGCWSGVQPLTSGERYETTRRVPICRGSVRALPRNGGVCQRGRGVDVP